MEKDKIISDLRDKNKRLIDENIYLRYIKKVDAITSIFRTFIIWGVLAVMVYLTTDMVKFLAGKETLANIGIEFITDIKANINQWLAYIDTVQL